LGLLSRWKTRNGTGEGGARSPSSKVTKGGSRKRTQALAAGKGEANVWLSPHSGGLLNLNGELATGRKSCMGMLWGKVGGGKISLIQFAQKKKGKKNQNSRGGEQARHGRRCKFQAARGSSDCPIYGFRISTRYKNPPCGERAGSKNRSSADRNQHTGTNGPNQKGVSPQGSTITKKRVFLATVETYEESVEKRR